MMYSTLHKTNAICNVDAGASPTWKARRGFSGATPTRAGAGAYTLNLDTKVDPARAIAQVTVTENQAAMATAKVATDGASLSVNTYDAAGAAVDVDFAVCLSTIFDQPAG